MNANIKVMGLTGAAFFRVLSIKRSLTMAMLGCLVFVCGMQTGVAKRSEIDFSKSQYFLALDKCPHPDPGWVYVKIADVDLRMPYDPKMGLFGYRFRTHAESNEIPEGCREHPVSLQTLFLYPYRNKLLPRWPISAINGLEGFELNNAVVPDWFQTGSEKLMHSMRSDGWCHNIGKGLEQCGSTFPVTPMTPFAYAISRLIYQTPSKHAFFVDCGALTLISSIYNYQCGIVYLLSNRLLLVYKFDRRKINIHNVVDLDRDLRKTLQSFIVRD